jgi:A-factor type gamma-butyrolactone 1'-reductase (1S-forming)
VASKHAVIGLTRTAAVEYGKYPIRVNAVRPGAVRTELLRDVFGSEEAVDRLAGVHPIGRSGRPEEIADAVLWLFSDKSSYYTGQSLTLDGGLTAHQLVDGYIGQKLSGALALLAQESKSLDVLRT